jgi:uroporphyrinogen III methyltransferase / synthase
MPSLRGRRILMTRARAQGDKLAAAIQEQGGTVVWVPAIRVIPLPLGDAGRELLGDLDRFRWVAFTSENASKFFFRLLKDEGLELPKHLRLASVGPATTKGLVARGLKIEAQPEIYTGLDLAKLLVTKQPRGPLLLPRSADGREELADHLRGAGWEVAPIAVYETRPAPITPDHVWAIEQGVDAALFASPSAVKALWEAIPETARTVLREAVCQPIGPTTARALQEVGLTPSPLPEHSTAEDLVKAVIARLGCC